MAPATAGHRFSFTEAAQCRITARGSVFQRPARALCLLTGQIERYRETKISSIRCSIDCDPLEGNCRP
jgi:hypothetical protein